MRFTEYLKAALQSRPESENETDQYKFVPGENGSLIYKQDPNSAPLKTPSLTDSPIKRDHEKARVIVGSTRG